MRANDDDDDVEVQHHHHRCVLSPDTDWKRPAHSISELLDDCKRIYFLKVR